MNMQKRSDERSKALHREIVKKLRCNPSLWDIPQNNILRWKKIRDRPVSAFVEWEHILNSKPKEQIMSILESDSEESTRLRSSSPFTGILSEYERKKIFELYNMKRYRTA